MFSRKNPKSDPIPEYEYGYDIGVNLIDRYASYAVPSMVRVGVTDFVITFAEFVISGVAMGICIMYAGDMIPVMSSVLEGATSINSVAPVLQEAISTNQLVVTTMTDATIEEILYYSSMALAA